MQITPHLSQTGASSTQVELLLFAGVVAIGLLAALAQRSRVPYPIFLVLAGLALGFLPGAPDVTLDPQLIFLIFLPPLLYAATYFASLSELRASAQPIAAMAIGLVMVTTFAVAIVVHTMVPHMSWAVAFTLGAIVSPTDAVAATTIMSRLDVPRRVAHLVDGESLLNDGTALVVYRLAVVAVVSGVFSIADAGWLFAASILGGVAVGVLAGTCIAFVRRRNHDGPTDVLLSLLSGYVAYLPAEALGVSGVLAAVTTGVWLGWRTPSIVRDPQTRLQIRAVWVNVQFVINVVLFLLVGLQLPGILRRLNAISYGELLWWSFAISATLVVTRLLWVFPAAYLPRRALFGNVHIAGRGARGRGRWRLPLLTSWVGMRGAVTLAAALALPLHTDSGAPFPHRDLLVFLAFGSIV
ncbi:MAG: Na+/H+ antiporter, partial [Thermoleophilia bacterium]|nr:Na+/H+ antiporter [Thermoleophilia bacterium]